MVIKGAGILFSWPEIYCFTAMQRAMQAMPLLLDNEVTAPHTIGTIDIEIHVCCRVMLDVGRFAAAQ
jgi:hypothetical protein